MNTVLRTAGEHSEHGWLLGLATALFLLLFITYTAWAFSRRSKEYLDEASNLPFEEDA